MNIVKQIIDKTGFSYSKLANETNINRFKISDYFNNKRDPSPEDKEVLTKYLSSLEPKKIEDKKEGSNEKDNIININIKKERKKRSSKYTEEERKERRKLDNDRGWLCCEKKHFGCLVTRKNQKVALDNEMKCPICGSKLILKSRRKNEENN